MKNPNLKQVRILSNLFQKYYALAPGTQRPAPPVLSVATPNYNPKWISFVIFENIFANTFIFCYLK
jgi:hypothetical protein